MGPPPKFNRDRDILVCQVLAGLGGVGKTQLAANLACQWWSQKRLDLLLWVTATSRTSVLTRYAQAAAEITGVADADPQEGAGRLLAWLAKTSVRWLIVLDDLTDPTDLTGLWPPSTASGRTVVTTRRRDTALLSGRALIDVDPFTRNEAVAYLRGKLGARAHRLAEAQELAEDLGWLPLALAQAAAYIEDQDLTCAGYRRRLVRRRLTALRPHVLPDDQQTAVADTWALSIKLANDATDGIAGVLLQVAALLDPNGIPSGLFATAAVIAHCVDRTGRPLEEDDTHDAVRALHRLSLATTVQTDDPAEPSAGSSPDAGLVRVHALLQRAVREATPIEHQRALAGTAAYGLQELWPEIERDATSAQILRANTTILHQNTGEYLWTTDDAHLVLLRAGRSLGTTGQVTAAVDYLSELKIRAEQILGPHHPDTLATRHSLAYWQGTAGDAAGAATAFAQLLTDRLRVLGPDHPGTLTTRHDVARWRGEAGNAAGAATAFAQLLMDRLRVLGPDHPDTLATRHNLAYWQGVAGDAASAANAFARLLPDAMRILGPDHPDTLATRHNLACWQAVAEGPDSDVAPEPPTATPRRWLPFRPADTS